MNDLLFLLTGILLGAGMVYMLLRGRYRDLRERLRLSEQYAREREDQEHRLLDSQWEKLQEQIRGASELILKQKTDQLSTANREQLSQILQPLQQHISLMREETQRMRHDHSVSLERLDATIHQQWEREKAMEAQAERLANALTSDSKVQGNFGELRLRQLLSQMGFEEGLQYDEQTALLDARGQTVQPQGHRLIPDVVLHFPDHRDVVIDSKVSLKAFVDYQNASTEEDRAEALSRHVQSLKAHVRELSQKQYHRHTGGEGGVRLDFVLMYVFQDAALAAAMRHDPQLWSDAASRGVIICGSQQLFITLRVLELSWKQARQVENQEQIMRCASALVERVQLFAERFEGVDQQLARTMQRFSELKSITASSGQSIVTSARQLLKYGIQENPRRHPLQPAPDTPSGEEDSPPGT